MSELASYSSKHKLVHAIKDSFQTMNAFKVLSLPKKPCSYYIQVLLIICYAQCPVTLVKDMNNSLLCVLKIFYLF